MNTEITDDRLLTGIEFIDRLIPATVSSQGVHAILGCTGTGITTLGCMIAAEGALTWKKRLQSAERGCWAFVTYQSSPADLMRKVGQYMGISAPQLMRRAESGCEEDAQTLREQINRRFTFCKQNILIIDYRGFASDPWRSPVQQITQHIRERIRNCKLMGIVFDDLDSITEARYLSLSNNPSGSVSTYYRGLRFSLACLRDIVQEHQCPVWIGYHLRGRLGGASPLSRSTDQDAMGFRGLRDFIDCSVILGNHDSRGMFQVSVSTKSWTNQDQVAVVRFDHGAKVAEVSPEMRKEFFRLIREDTPLKVRPEVRRLIMDRNIQINKSLASLRYIDLSER